ncbi:PD-(D/E)XK nuclease family protein [Geodermatophilus dictyosporus]|uniref:PD-(D/E)XK nuclease family protein n=1 Tax=Geodermatophilus dictyosporus TaxID=1523247 RepID=UPI000B832E0D|nr:PD-(D/E)XK nuclease family protein [Geodermatophilus dictyosporus]
MKDVLTWSDRLAQMTDEWSELRDSSAADAMKIAGWEQDLRTMTVEEHALRRAGRWRSGPRTLLAALGLQQRELALTAGLAWILNPEGHHGLGSLFVKEFAVLCGADAPDGGPVTITVEETREDTRADLVLRCSTFTLVLECKVWALEQPDQCRRLANLWADEDPVLVFLTPRGLAPVTAGDTEERWRCLTWADVTNRLRAATLEAPQPAYGVLDYLETLANDLGRTI